MSSRTRVGGKRPRSPGTDVAGEGDDTVTGGQVDKEGDHGRKVGDGHDVEEP